MIKRLLSPIRLLILVAIFCVIFSSPVSAAKRYWIGTSDNTVISDSNNWSATQNSCGVGATASVPGASDVAYFTSSCSNSASIDQTWSVQGINIGAGFSGSLGQVSGKMISIGVSGYTQVAGTFSGSGGTTANDAIDINSSSFSVTGGSFISTAGALTVEGSFTVTAPGTFTHNSGTVSFDGGLCGNSTINASGVVFNTPVTINRSANCSGISIKTFTISAGTTIPLGDASTLNLIDSRADTNARYNLVNNGSITSTANSLTINIGSTSYAGTFTNNGSFDMSTLTTLTINGDLVNTAGKTVGSNSITSFSAYSVGNSGTVNLDNVSTFSINGTLTNSAGAAFITAAGPTFNVAGGFVINSGSTFPTSNVNLNLNGTLCSSSTIDAPTVTFNAPVTINRSAAACGINIYTLTINTGTIIPLGNSDTVNLISRVDSNARYHLTNNGTITTTASTLTINIGSTSYAGTFTNNGSFTSDTLNDFSIGNLTNSSGANFTVTNGSTFNIAGSLVVDSGSTFPTSNINLNLNGTSSDNSIIDAPTVAFNTPVIINRSGDMAHSSPTLTIGVGTSIPLGNDAAITLRNTHNAAYLYNLTNNGNITAGTGTLTINLNGPFGGNGTFTNNGTFSSSSLTTLTINGHLVNNASKTITSNTITTLSALNLTNSGVMAISNISTITTNGSFTNNSGAAFTPATNATFNIAGSFIINSGSTFPASNVNLNLNGSLNIGTTIDASTVTFNAPVIINRSTSTTGTGPTLVIAAGTIIPLGDTAILTLTNTQSGSGYNLINNGTITSGTGTLTVNMYNNALNTAGTFTNNGTFDITSSGTWIMNGHFTNSSGSTVLASATTGYSTKFNTSINAASTFPASLGTLTIIGTSGTQSYDNSKTTNYSAFVKNAASKLNLFQGFDVGDFTLSGGTIPNPATSMTINISGNFSQSVGPFGGVNLPVVFNGAADKTITQTSGTFLSPFTVSKTNAAVSLASNFNTISQACTVSSGIFDINGKYFTCGSTLTIQDGGTLRLIGSETIATPTLDPGSNVSYKGDGGGGLTDTFDIQPWTYSNLTINTNDSDDVVSASPDSLRNGLVLYWPMNELSGTEVSDTRGINNATAYNGAAIVDGKFGKARDFVSADSQYLTSSTNIGITGAATRSVSFWFKPGNIQGDQGLFSWGTVSSTKNFSLRYDHINEGLYFWGQASDLSGHTDTITRGVWNHVVVTYNGTILKVYANGDTTPDISGNLTLNTTDSTVNIGGPYSWPNNLYYSGSIDDFRIYNRVLTDSEVVLLASGNLDSGATLAALTINKDFTLNSGTFISPSTLNIGGNFNHSGGIFTHNNGTVSLVGTNQQILGDTAFKNLSKVISPGIVTSNTLTFEADKTQTITGELTLTGLESNLLNLVSSVPGTKWKIDPQSTRNISYVSVSDSNNINATTIDLTDNNITLVENNSGWGDSNLSPIAPTSLGPAGLVGGGFTANTQPQLTFTLADPDAGDTVKYQIQIATDSGFTSIVTDYTSDLGATGGYTYTVGTTLTEGSYYWRVKAIDNSDAASDWTAANDGVAFKVDTQSPSLSGIPSTTTPTNQTSQVWNWSAATDALSAVITYLWRTTGSAIISGSTTLTNAVTNLAEGVYDFFVKSQDEAGNESAEQQSSLTVDISAPITTDSGIDTNWHNTNVTVTLNCDDGSGVGCANTYFTTNSSIPTISSAIGNTIILTSDGIYTIKYFSVDAVGNTESIKTAANTVKIDKTNPGTPGIPSTTTPTTSVAPTWNWVASSESGSGINYYTVQWASNNEFSSNLGSTAVTTNSFTHLTNLVDGTWYFRVMAIDNAGNTSPYTSAGNVLIDTTAPNTTDSGIDSSWHTTPITVTLACNDNGSGCANTYFTTNGSTPTLSSSVGTTITLSTDSIYTIKYFSVDGVGNTETTKTAEHTVKIDTTSPSGGSLIYPNGYLTSLSVGLTLVDGLDSQSDIDTASRSVQRHSAILTNGACGDFGDWAAISPSGSYPNFIDTVVSGNCYQYRFLVSDLATNQVTYTSANTVKIDTSLPTTPGIPSTSTPTSSSKPTWNWTASTDSDSGLDFYTLQWASDSDFTTNLASSTTPTNSFTHLTNLSDGTWYFKVKSSNLIGSTSPYTLAGSVLIDTTSPTTTDSGTDTAWHNSNVVVTLTCDDTDGSGCANTYFTTNGSTPTTSSDVGTTITLSSDGIYTIKYFSVDGVGNTESIKTAENTVKIDSSLPSTPGIPSTTTPTNQISQTWTWTAATDALSSTIIYLWRTTGTAIISGTTSLTNTVTNLTEGIYDFFVKSQDEAGNESAEQQSNLVVDTSAPTTTDSGTDTNWHNTNVTVTLNCNDGSGVGCANTYFTTNGSTPTLSSSVGTTITLNTNGIYTIKYFSVDSVGNTEVVKNSSNTVKIDKTAPTSGSLIYPNGYLTSLSVGLTLADGLDSQSDIDNASRAVQRRSATLTNGTCSEFDDWVATSPAGSYPNFTDTVVSGNCYQYRYLVSDLAANQVIYTSANTVKIDASLPTTPGIPSTTTPTNLTSQTWTWTAATDALSGVANYLWRITNNLNEAISDGTTELTTLTTNLVQGVWNLFVKSVDQASNQSSESSSSLTVDTTSPLTTSSGTDTSWHNNNVTVTLSCTDSGGSSCAQTYFTTNGSTPTLNSSVGTTITLSTDGIYTIKYFSVDGVGNTESTKTAAHTVKIDKTVPTASGVPSTTTPTKLLTQLWTWSAAADTLSHVANYHWRVVNQDTGETLSDIINTNSVETSLTEGSWNFYTKAIDQAGNTGPENSSAVIVDTTPPEIYSIIAESTNNGATVRWETTEPASSQLYFGLTSIYGETTPKTDVDNGVSSHELSLSNLVPCVTYHYQVASQDAAGNLTNSSDNRFTTLGCAGSASILSQSALDVSTTSPVTIDLLDNDQGISLNIPADATDIAANYQIKKLDQSEAFSSTSTPNGVTSAGDYVYDLKSLVDVETKVSTFNKSITVTLKYGPEDIVNIDENSLKIYRWDESSWHVLADSVVDKTNKTVTGTTTAFSVFSLFGEQLAISSPPTNNSNNSSTNSVSDHVCHNTSPASSPDLFQIDATKNSALIYFAPSKMPYTSYFIAYGKKPDSLEYGTEFSQGYSGGVLSHKINILSPNTTYYFKIRAGNGCMPGEWSQTFKITTPINQTVKKYYKFSSVPQIIINKIKNIIKPNLKTPSTIVTQPEQTSNPVPTLASPQPVSSKPKFCFLWWCF